MPYSKEFLLHKISGYAKSFESVPDLERAMYININGYPCVRLLNVSGEIGCSSMWNNFFFLPKGVFLSALLYVNNRLNCISINLSKA